MMADPTVDMIAVGDVFVDRDDPDAPFDQVRSILHSAQIVFGNQEGVYSDTTVRSPSSGIQMVVPSSRGAVLRAAGFTVMSCANNHIVDAGYEGLADTLEILRRQGIATLGAGRNLEEARTPHVLEENGLRVAFLAYASVFPAGYDAKERRPGLAPARADTFYAFPDPKQIEAPARAPRIVTLPFQPDVDALRKDIAAVAERADVVIASFHWGIFPDPFLITDYERQYARVAIDSGATVVLGHHHHTLRGIEVYRGRPIFYGLGQFVFDLPRLHEQVTETQLKEMRKKFGDFALFERPDQPFTPMHPDALKSMLVYLRLERGAVQYAGVLPCQLGSADGVVRPCHLGSQEGTAVLEYLTRGCEEPGLGAKLKREGGQLLDGYALASVQLDTPS